MFRWLEWAQVSLKFGRGGVEVHSREFTRELKKLGIECEQSARKEDLYQKKWDVIRTHGSSFPLFWKRPQAKKWVHTLHGSTFGRMISCREFFWLGGYHAAIREWITSYRCDVLHTVNKQLWIYRFFKFFGKKSVSMINGWDTADFEDSAENEFEIKCPNSFFLFIGRGGDFVKGVSLIHELLKAHEDLNLVAIPGDGFENHPRILKTGPLSSKGIFKILLKSNGLLLTSYYEGCPIVVMEALGNGIPVYSTNTSILKELSTQVKGLHVFDSRELFSSQFQKIKKLSVQSLKNENAKWNQSQLMRWSECAEKLLKEVQKK